MLCGRTALSGSGWRQNCDGKLDSLETGRYGSNVKSVILKFTLETDILNISCEIALKWMPQALTDDKSKLGSANNVLVPSGSKPLQPMFPKVCDAVWRHSATVS